LNNKKEIVPFKKLPWLIILSTIVLIAISIPRLIQLKFDYNIENFFDPEDSDLIYYHQHRDTYESDNNFILIGIENKNGIFKTDFLHLIDSTTKIFKGFKHVENIVCPTTLKKVIKVPIAGYINVPVIHLNEPSRIQEDKEKIYKTNDFFQSFFSKDTTSILIYITKDVDISKSANDSLVSQIESVLKTFNYDDFHIAGKVKTQNYYVSTMNNEMKLLTCLTSFLLILFLSLTFRSFWSVFTPLLILLTSLIFTLTLIQIFIGALDLLMTLMPTLLFIIGVSNSVHILTGYNEEYLIHKNKYQALKKTIKKIGKTTFLTSLTTAIGFISLYFIDIPPIQNFGIATAIGVMITWLVSITALPCAIYITQTRNYTRNLKKEKKWDAILTPLFNVIFKYKRHTIVITSLLLILSGIGIYKLETNNYLLDDLSEKSSLKKDMRFFESQFAGIRPFEMGFSIKDTSLTIFNIDVAKEIDTVQFYLENVYGAKMSYSSMTIAKEINRSINGGNQEFYRVPKTVKEMKNVKKYFTTSIGDDVISTLLTKDFKNGRITGKIHDLGQRKVSKLNNSLQDFIDANISLINFRITGAPDMMDKTNAYISSHIIKGLTFSFLVVALLMGIIFRSLKIALISLIPNVLPLLFVAGLMGLIGVDLKFSTVVIFTIGFGIAVDDTIHLLVRYKYELPRSKNSKESLYKSILTTGKALIITSFILSSGFLTFLLSDFSSTFYIGLLISITLLFALISDLFLLPILIIYFDKKKEDK
jgi:predicted RND superfamily exporter protein